MADQGVVTIMHADVEGSTALTTRLGDEAGRRALEDTKRIVRERSEAHGARLIDAVGDSMMLTFTSTRQAIAGAIAVQKALAEGERERPDEALRVRIGLNVGEVLERDGQTFGAAVNAGARVMAKAAGGQILVSEMVRRLAGTIPGVSYRERGRHAFRGFEERWRLYEVVWDRPARPSKPAKRRRGLPSRRALALAAVALCAVAGGIVVAWLLTRPSPGLPGVEPNHVGLIDPGTAKIVEQIEVGSHPSALAAAAGTLWVASYEGRSITRIDEESGERATIAVAGHPSALTADAGGAWVAATLEGRLIRIDHEFDRAGAAVAVEAASISAAGGYLWVTRDGTTLRRLDRSGRLAGAEIVLEDGARSVVSQGQTVWVAGQVGVTPVDARTGIPGPFVRLLGSPGSLAAGAGAVWATVRRGEGNVVQKVDPDSVSSAGYARVGGDPGAVAVVGDSVWVANRSEGTVSRVRIEGLRPVGVVRIGATPTALASGARGLWVAAR